MNWIKMMTTTSLNWLEKVLRMRREEKEVWERPMSRAMFYLSPKQALAAAKAEEMLIRHMQEVGDAPQSNL
jgi:hypothetical protein